jgi:glycosyltransferase involved in cell wall biosynthesis
MDSNMTIKKVNYKKGSDMTGNVMTGNKKIRVLFESWFSIPHSYAICNCFQLVYLVKNFSDKMDIYIREKEYFNPMWNNNKKLVYPSEHNEIIKNLKQYNGEPIDLIYRQTFPYDISVSQENEHIPKCVFYTSEFASLDTSYFKIEGVSKDIEDNFIVEYLKKYNNIHFLAPSTWSSLGMKKYLKTDEPRRNKIITHGVDTTIFKKDITKRKEIRDKYGVKDTDILMINIGSMTRNKGIVLILQTLHVLVNKLQKSEYKLLLKGTSDLYQSKLFLEFYFGELQKQGVMTSLETQHLLTNHIIFTDKTLSYQSVNQLFNASDLYISPYLCEGFGLTMLEALASGLNVLVPITGSTSEYMTDIYHHGGSEHILYVPSHIMNYSDKCENNIDINQLLHVILAYDFKKAKHNYEKMHAFIEENYSWNQVSKLLYNHFVTIIDQYRS